MLLSFLVIKPLLGVQDSESQTESTAHVLSNTQKWSTSISAVIVQAWLSIMVIKLQGDFMHISVCMTDFPDEWKLVHLLKLLIYCKWLKICHFVAEVVERHTDKRTLIQYSTKERRLLLFNLLLKRINLPLKHSKLICWKVLILFYTWLQRLDWHLSHVHHLHWAN